VTPQHSSAQRDLRSTCRARSCWLTGSIEQCSASPLVGPALGHAGHPAVHPRRLVIGHRQALRARLLLQERVRLRGRRRHRREAQHRAKQSQSEEGAHLLRLALLAAPRRVLRRRSSRSFAVLPRARRHPDLLFGTSGARTWIIITPFLRRGAIHNLTKGKSHQSGVRRAVERPSCCWLRSARRLGRALGISPTQPPRAHLHTYVHLELVWLRAVGGNPHSAPLSITRRHRSIRPAGESQAPAKLLRSPPGRCAAGATTAGQ
jgi:hypothetical protein